MEGSDFREAGKQIDQNNGPRALASKAPNEMPKIGYRGREERLYRRNNRTRRQHGLKMSNQSRKRRSRYVRGGMQERTYGRKNRQSGRIKIMHG